MIETLQKIIESPAGSFSFVFGLMALAGWLIHYTTKFVVKIRVEYESTNKRIDKTESNIDTIRNDIAYMKGDVAFLKNSFEIAVGSKDSVTRKKSPVSLTEIGEEIKSSNNLDSMVDNNWNKIIAHIQRQNITNPYDIQQFCIENTFTESLSFFTEEDIEKLKNISFRTGNNLLSITRLMGVIIRDRYFVENRINIDDVDKNDPNNNQEN